LIIRIDQLPVFAARWQHGPGYILQLLSNEKSQNNSTMIDARKNRHRFGILKILEFFLCILTKEKDSQIL